VSASVLTCTGLPSLQARTDELAGSLTSSCDIAGHAPQKTRRPSVEPALVIGLGHVAGRVEPFSDDLVQQPGDASIRIARHFFETGFHRRRDPPRVHLSLSGHALHGSAIRSGNQSTPARKTAWPSFRQRVEPHRVASRKATFAPWASVSQLRQHQLADKILYPDARRVLRREQSVPLLTQIDGVRQDLARTVLPQVARRRRRPLIANALTSTLSSP
jgi:hypothetical protein